MPGRFSSACVGWAQNTMICNVFL